jgi:PTS system nitrogen regulatory IIA component
VITQLIGKLTLPSGSGPSLPPASAIDRDQLLEAVLEREALMPTAVGCGIALPHPRNPLVSSPSEEFVTVAFLKQPVDWQALDGKPVHTVMLIVSASAKLHLHTLSRINFFCRQEASQALFENRAPADRIIRAIKDAEDAWE